MRIRAEHLLPATAAFVCCIIILIISVTKHSPNTHDVIEILDAPGRNTAVEASAGVQTDSGVILSIAPPSPTDGTLEDGWEMVKPTERVDINSASVYELAGVLPGIGEGKARSIVEYRKLIGGFRSIDELTEVSGIGDKLLERIRPYCYIGGTSNTDTETPKPNGDMTE